MIFKFGDELESCINYAHQGQVVSDDKLLLYALGGLDDVEFNSVVAILTTMLDLVSLYEAQFLLQCHKTCLYKQNSC